MTYINKTVDGVEVALTPQEIADLNARDAAWTTIDTFRQGQAAREAALKADQSVIDWESRLTTFTPSQIDNFFAANVTSTAQAIVVLKAIVKFLAKNS